MNILKPYREQIDALDDRILELLAQRTIIVRAVGAAKAEHHLALIQSERMTEVIERCTAIGVEKGLDPDMVRDLYTRIIDEAHVIEGAIIKAKSA